MRLTFPAGLCSRHSAKLLHAWFHLIRTTAPWAETGQGSPCQTGTLSPELNCFAPQATWLVIGGIKQVNSKVLLASKPKGFTLCAEVSQPRFGTSWLFSKCMRVCLRLFLQQRKSLLFANWRALSNERSEVRFDKLRTARSVGELPEVSICGCFGTGQAWHAPQGYLLHRWKGGVIWYLALCMFECETLIARKCLKQGPE